MTSGYSHAHMRAKGILPHDSGIRGLLRRPGSAHPNWLGLCFLFIVAGRSFVDLKLGARESTVLKSV